MLLLCESSWLIAWNNENIDMIELDENKHKTMRRCLRGSLIFKRSLRGMFTRAASETHSAGKCKTPADENV